MSTPSLTVAAEGSCDPVMVGLVAIVGGQARELAALRGGDRRAAAAACPAQWPQRPAPFAGRVGEPVPASVRDQTAAAGDALLQPVLDHYEGLLRLPAATT